MFPWVESNATRTKSLRPNRTAMPLEGWTGHLHGPKVDDDDDRLQNQPQYRHDAV